MKKPLFFALPAIIMGLVFVVSGFVKAVDPVGFSYKIEEYLVSFGLAGLKNYSLYLSIALCSSEMLLGVMLLLRIWKRIVSVCLLAVMLVFTAFTVWLVADPLNSITDCGCFGEVISLSNTASLLKNVILIIVAIVNVIFAFVYRDDRKFELCQIGVFAAAGVLSLMLPVLSFLFLPPFYFLHYNVGDRIQNANRIELFDDGPERVEISLNGDDRPLYLIGLRKEMTEKEVAKIQNLYKSYLDKKVDMVIASPMRQINNRQFRDVPVYYIDDMVLKSILRSEVGIVAISKGRIVGKWNLTYSPYRFKSGYGNEMKIQLFLRYGMLLVLLSLLVVLFMIRVGKLAIRFPRKGLLVICFVSSIISSCSSFEVTRKRAEDNWPELKKVLDKYSKGEDIEKYEATVFLLNNMPYHFYQYGKELEELKSGFQLLREADDDSFGMIVDSLTGKVMCAVSADIYWDVQSLDSDYICNNIEWAFKVWREQPWGKNVDFDMFCNYILPYRIGDEVPTEWRESYYNTFNPLLDEFRESGQYDTEDPVEAFRFLMSKLPILYKPRYAPRFANLFPHVGPENVKYFIGSCREYTDFVIYVCRAIGIPCAYNWSFNMHRANVGHQWACFWNKYGEEYIISNYPPVLVPNRQDYTMATPKMKVYRETYSINEPLLMKAMSSRSPMNLFYSLPTYLDVTAIYTNRLKRELSIPVNELYHRVPRNEAIYLCSCSRMRWCPEDYDLANGEYMVFRDVQTDEVYCLCRKSESVYLPISDPFCIESRSQDIQYFRNTGEIGTVEIKSKFSVSFEEKMFRDRMKNGVFEGSDEESFENSDTLYIIQSAPDRKNTRVEVYSASRKSYNYLRYMGTSESYCDVADISFFCENGSSIEYSRILGTAGFDVFHPCTNAFDGSSQTSFSGSVPNESWCGIELKESCSIGSIAYTPRNRDNFINEGDVYELFYYDREWKSLGLQSAESDILLYENVPLSCLLLLKNHSGGVQERFFTFEGGKQVWR